MQTARSLEIARILASRSTLRNARELGILGSAVPTPEGAREFRETLERLGTTFVKLGQVLASRPDLIGTLYADELASLHDDIAPLPWDVVRETVERSLGFTIDEVFSRFDREPLAAASIAQAHAAVRRDTLQEVVVKVRRPDIAAEVERDLEILGGLARRADDRLDAARLLQVRSVADDLAWSLRRELDMRSDARNGELLAAALADHEQVRVPQVHADLVTEDVLVMEHVRGVHATDPSVALMLPEDRTMLAEGLLRAFVRQVLVDGVYHADPHAGNVLVDVERREVILLDFGLVGRLDDNTRLELGLVLLAMAENRAGDMSDMILHMSSTDSRADPQRFQNELRRLLPRYHGAALGQIDVGHAIIDIQRLALECDIGLPIPFALIGKTLSQVDSIARTLDPAMDPLEVIRGTSFAVLRSQVEDLMSPSALLAVLGPRALPLLDLPKRVERLMDGLERGSVSIGITPHVEEAVGELRTITNRLSASIVIAASIVASALLMNVRGVGTIAGYPALGLGGFLVSFALAVIVILRMVRTEGGI